MTFLAILFRTTGDMGVVGVPFVDSEASALFLAVGVLAAKGVVVFVPAAALPFRFTLTTTSASILTSSSKLNSYEREYKITLLFINIVNKTAYVCFLGLFRPSSLWCDIIVDR